MWKLNRAEINKIFMRPAVYVMVAVLTIALVLFAITFLPSSRYYEKINLAETGDTVAVAFTKFNSNTGLSYSKPTLDNKLENLKTSIENFSSNNHAHNFLKTKIDSIFNTLTENTGSTLLQAYVSFKTHENTENRNALTSAMQSVKTTTQEIYNYLNHTISADNIDFYLSTSDHNWLKEYFRGFYLAIPAADNLISISSADLNTHAGYILDNYTPTKQKEFIDSAKTFTFETETINNLINNYYATIAYSAGSETTLTKLYLQIKDYATAHSNEKSEESINELNELVNQYRNITDISHTILLNEFSLLKAGGLSDVELEKYIGFKNFNSYKIQETLSLNKHLLENEIFDGNYLLNFNYSSPTGYIPSAYDFTFSAMQVLSIILTIFAVFFAVSIVAGDMQNGTIKMLATRPFSRTSIISGKTLACFNFILIFAIFAFVASFAIGLAKFGLGSAGNVLMVINASTVVSVPPILSLLLYFITVMLNILFYIVVAILFSVIFRSSTLSLFLSIVLILGGFVLNGLWGDASWFMFTPYAYLDLFKFFGGGSATPWFLTLTLTTGMSALASCIIYGILILVITTTSKIIFKNRDIA